MVDETAPATPPPEPEVKLELEADVVVECPATPRLEASRPIDCAPGTCTQRLVGGAKECFLKDRKRAPPDIGIR